MAETAHQKIEKALVIAANNAQTDGAHHKLWVIDQMVRALLGADYEQWIIAYTANGKYTWDVGIAP